MKTTMGITLILGIALLITPCAMADDFTDIEPPEPPDGSDDPFPTVIIVVLVFAGLMFIAVMIFVIWYAVHKGSKRDRDIRELDAQLARGEIDPRTYERVRYDILYDARH